MAVRRGLGSPVFPGWGLDHESTKGREHEKDPVLLGLAARAPYFHNGMAVDLEAVVDFYDTRFSIGFTDREKDDLVAFLEAP